MRRRDYLTTAATSTSLIGILAAIGHSTDDNADVDEIAVEAHGGETEVEPEHLTDCDP
jgi:hypothetical protein